METKIFDRFIKFKSVRVRENSLIAYTRDLNMLYSYLEKTTNVDTEEKMLSMVDNEMLEDFFYNMIEEKKSISVATLNRRVASIKSFFKYVYENYSNLISSNPARNLKQYVANDIIKEVQEKEIVTKDEYMKMIFACDIRKKGAMLHEFTSVRDKLIISLMASTGMRMDTVRKIELNDIEKKDGYYIIDIPPHKHKSGKKIKKNLRVPLVGVVKKYYEAYLFERSQLKNIVDDTYLILSIGGKKIDAINAQNIIKKLLEKANINKNITAHSFRAFYKEYAVQSKIDSALISLVGGWSQKNIEDKVYYKDGKHLDDIKANEIIKILG